MGPLFGLDLEATIGEADTVVLADLPNNDKVQVVGNTIYLLQGPIEDIARCHISAEEARAWAILYFVHELAHLPQGIGDYASVVALRAISEEALLRLDLVADHVAALAYQRITGAPLTAIKAMLEHTIGKPKERDDDGNDRRAGTELLGDGRQRVSDIHDVEIREKPRRAHNREHPSRVGPSGDGVETCDGIPGHARAMLATGIA
jgi:hypothetical protein